MELPMRVCILIERKAPPPRGFSFVGSFQMKSPEEEDPCKTTAAPCKTTVVF